MPYCVFRPAMWEYHHVGASPLAPCHKVAPPTQQRADPNALKKDRHSCVGPDHASLCSLAPAYFGEKTKKEVEPYLHAGLQASAV